MQKIATGLLIVIGICILVVILVLWFVNKKYSVLHFEESDKITINPSRGFYDPVASKNFKSIDLTRENGMTLCFIEFDIEDFKDREISPEKLDELNQCFLKARKNGLKVILRVAYGFDRESREPDDMNVINAHIMQLKPILYDNSDIIYVLQAGILGPWGEWHNSSHGNPPTLQARNAVIKMWQSVVGNDVFIAVRRPSFIRDMYPDEKLNEENAYADTGIARIGWHNDALLSTYNDMGTYRDNLSKDEELVWSSNYNLFAPFGGETNYFGEYANSKNAVKEFELLRISYLNSRYHQDVLEGWKNETYNNENAFEYITKKLGYRYVIDSITANKKIRPDSNIKTKIKISNTGFAPVYFEYKINLVLLDSYGQIYRSQIKTDVRTWQPGELITLSTKIKTPVITSKSGILRVGLEIVDGYPSLCENDLYNIELSNDAITYVDGVNYFAYYKIIDGKYVLIT